MQLSELHSFIKSLLYSPNPTVNDLKNIIEDLFCAVSAFNHATTNKVAHLKAIFDIQTRIAQTLLSQPYVSSYLKVLAGDKSNEEKADNWKLVSILPLTLDRLKNSEINKLYMTHLTEITKSISEHIGTKNALTKKQLSEFLSNEFILKQIATPTNTNNSIFKSAGSQQVAVSEVKEYVGATTPDGNLFNEAIVDAYHPSVANTIRSYRDSTAAQVRGGQLVTHIPLLLKDFAIPRVLLVDISSQPDKLQDQLILTLHYKIYNAIKDGTVRNQDEAISTILTSYSQLIKDDPRLELSDNIALKKLREICGNFNHIFSSNTPRPSI